MNRTRRQLLRFALGSAGLCAIAPAALAQAYPSRPVRIVVAFPAGGPVDIVGRMMAQWLSERLGQPFVVDNRPGAGGNIGAESVVKSAADGYTLLVCGPVNTINASLYANLSFDFAAAVTPVAGIVRVPLAMVVNPSLPVRSIPELIQYAKANPGRVNMASAGNGTPQHVAGELFKMMAGVDMLHVPYKGSAPAITDLLGGQVQLMFDAMPSAIEHVRAGRLRALGVTTARRAAILPDVPSVGEFLPGYEAGSWYGIVGPRDMPADVVKLLNEHVNAGLADAAIGKRLADMGGVELAGSPVQFGRLIAEETAKWRQVVRSASIRVE